jgi:PKD repeat protein
VPGQARPEFKRLSISGDVDRYIVLDNIFVNCPYGNGVTVPVYIPNGGYIKISNSEIKGTIGVHSSCGKLCEQVSTNYILQFGQEGSTGIRDLILENSHCHTSRTGVRLEGDSFGGIVFRGNHVHDFGGSMFKLKGDTHGQTVYIENNNMHTQLAMWRHSNQFPAGGEYVHGSGLSLRCENVTARNNIIRACAASTQITTYRYIFPEHGYRNMRFENNLLYDSRSPYYSIRLDDIGNNLVFNNNTITGRHYDGRTKANYFNNVLKLDGYAANVDIGTFQINNNIFVGSCNWGLKPIISHGGSVRGNLFYSYNGDGGDWKDQNWMNSNMPGNKVYCWNTSEPMDFRTSGVIFKGGELFNRYAYYRVPDSSYAPGHYHNVDLGDCFELAESSNAVGFADPAYAPSDALGVSEGYGGFIGPARQRDSDPDAGAYEYDASPGGNEPYNNPPVLEPIADKSVRENTTLEFMVTATDPDEDALSYSAINLPNGASFDSETGLFIWAIQQGQAGNYSVTFSVSDGDKTDSQEITITVGFQDDDSDSLPDVWEMQYFGNLDQEPGNDPDNDNFTNLQEYQNGTNPTVFDNRPAELVLDMKFNDDPADGAIDSSPYGNDGYSPVESTPAIAVGQRGNAYEFDGVDDYINCGADASLNLTENLTISAWIFPKSFGHRGYGRILDKGNGVQGFSFYLRQSGGQIAYITYGQVVSYSNDNVVTLNKWQHVATVYNKTAQSVIFYVDGQQVGSSDNVAPPLDSSSNSLFVGIRGYDLSRAFDGLIDEVRVYNKALTQAEILDIFNESPTLAFAPIGDKVVDEGNELSFAVETAEPATEVFMSDHNLPGLPSFVAKNFNWTPTYDDAGSYEATFIAPNGEIEDVETITITVNNLNRSPVIEAIGNKMVDENVELAFDVAATDPDGDSILFSANNLPTGAVFANQAFRWRPSYAQAGTYDISLIASDGELEDVESLTITVNNVNRAPVLAEIGNKSVDENQTLAIELIATDADGDAITYLAENLPTGALLSGNTFIWTPAFGQAGDYQVTFIASDGQETDSQTVTITVVESIIHVEGLIGHWQLDGNAIDSSGKGNDGYPVNGPIWTTGKIGGAVSLDGINDYINCQADPILNLTDSFTIGAWIKPKSYGQSGWGRIVDKGSKSTGFSFYIRKSTGSLAYVIYGGLAIRSNSDVINLNTWQHVAMVYNRPAESVTFYVNGLNAGTVYYTTPPLDSAGNPLLIGIRGYDLKRAFDGLIDDVQIYNRALTADEINQL